MNYKEKVDRALSLIDQAYREHGEHLIVANSLGKDSTVIWDLAKKVSKDIKGFIVTTRYKPFETKGFMSSIIHKYPELKVYANDQVLPDEYYRINPDECCNLLKVQPTREAIEDFQATCWVTGLREDEGHTRKNLEEIQELDEGLVKLNPIFYFTERDVWQYIAINKLPVNPLYSQGYRSLGCAPCTAISEGEERAGRWKDTCRVGGECGIHFRSLKGVSVGA